MVNDNYHHNRRFNNSKLKTKKSSKKIKKIRNSRNKTKNMKISTQIKKQLFSLILT